MAWISLSPAYGSSNTIPTEVDKIQVAVNNTNMTVGTNSGLVYIWDSAPGVSQLISVPVTITVTQTGTTTPPPPSPTTGTVTASWAPNSEADLAGYKLYIGTASGVYSRIVDVGNVTSYTIALAKGVTYFFAVTAYDKSGNESTPSAEISRSLF